MEKTFTTNSSNTNDLHQKWLNAGLSNDFIFFKVMSENPDVCKRLIEILLNIQIEKIEIQNDLKMKSNADSKGIRLDLFVKNSTHIFDIEVQVKNTNDLPERARYYQSIMDRTSLFMGSKYSQMKTSHVIFLCIEDIFNAGRPIYSFENLCLQDSSLKLNDRAFKHFFVAKNCDKIKGNDELKSLLKLLVQNEPTSVYTKNLKVLIESAKLDPQSEETYMEWERQKTYLREEGFAIGLAEGSQQKALETAKNLFKMNILSEEQIVQATGLTLEQLHSLQSS